jgi:hypothetical protein
MSSLAELAEILDKLDLDKDGRHVLQNISYGITFNESLGFKDVADFHVSQPYISWPEDVKDENPPSESPLAIAFKDVVERGLAASTTNKGNVFIDIASLAGGWEYYFLNTHTGANVKQENLAQAFSRMVRNIPKEATPVIRILLGMRGKPKTDGTTWKSDLQQEFKNLFWPGGDYSLHPNAEVYIGFYSPSFDAA